MMLYVLSGTIPSRARILDLGCGTGSLSERVLARFPRARVVAVDYDPVLLQIGRTGLGNAGGRLTWVDADLRTSDWATALPRGRFDAAVTSTAMHWLTTAELGRLYRILGRTIRPGGIFLNADHIASGRSTPRLRKILGRAARERGKAHPPPPGERWSDWWGSVLADPSFAVEAKLHRARFPRAHRRTQTADLPGHVNQLRRAGFREVGVVWSRGQNRIVAAVR